MVGLTAENLLVAAARKPGLCERLLKEALEGREIKMVTPAEIEAGLRDAGEWPAGESTSQPSAEPAAAERPAEPPPKPPWELYAEEKCRWRLRGPDDYDCDDKPRGGYFCEFGYDPLKRP